eukprot:GFYU01002988.1.p1 GENE.GFYU01002988.1~~GFYU01002988.1.p1  ORF type:complete len:507 (+),score=82.39 GFYU01002988.1:169-1689(+)
MLARPLLLSPPGWLATNVVKGRFHLRPNIVGIRSYSSQNTAPTLTGPQVSGGVKHVTQALAHPSCTSEVAHTSLAQRIGCQHSHTMLQGERHRLYSMKTDGSDISLSPEAVNAGAANLKVCQDDVVGLTQDLVKLDSQNPPGNEHRVAEFIAQWAVDNGLESEVIPVDDSGDCGRSNVVVRLPGTGSKDKLVFCGHLDVVPYGEGWTKDPVGGEVIDGRLYGRGSVDMKGGIAAMLTAMATVKRQGVQLGGDLYFLGTADEEQMHLGAKQMAASTHPCMTDVSGMIISEPTELELIVAHRGAFWGELTTHGRSCHASVPHLGVNAIVHMSKVLSALSEIKLSHTPHDLIGKATFNIGLVEGGTSANVVPDTCKATIDIRTVPGQSGDTVRSDIERIVDEVKTQVPDLDYSLNVTLDQSPMNTSVDHSFTKTALSVASQTFGVEMAPVAAPYYTDGGVLQPSLNGAPVIILGPGQVSQCHVADEHVAVDELSKASDFYSRIALAWLL